MHFLENNKFYLLLVNILFLFFFYFALFSSVCMAAEDCEDSKDKETHATSIQEPDIPLLDLTRSESRSSFSSSGSPASHSSSETFASSHDKTDQKKKGVPQKRRERSLSRSISNGLCNTRLSLKRPLFYSHVEENVDKSLLSLEIYQVTIQKWIENSKDYSNIAKKIIFSYPMFIDEKNLFIFLNNLKNKYPKIIKSFAVQLAFNGFPNGVENLQGSFAEFKLLLEGVTDSPIFSEYFLDSVRSSSLKLEIKSGNQFDWQECSIGDIVENICIRDCCLFQAINFHDLEQFTKNEKSPPESIQEIAKHFNGTTEWIFKVIENEREEKRKKNLIKKFMLIGRLLHQKSNFHGTLQVVLGLEKALKLFLPEEEAKDADWLLVSSTVSATNNFIKYRELLATPHQPSTCLPMFPVVSRDILHAYEVFTSDLESKKKDVASSAVEGIASLLENFLKHKRMSYPTSKQADPHNPIFQFIWGLKALAPEEN